MRYALLITIMLFSVVAANAQQQSGTRQDSIAQAKVIELLEADHLLPYYDENINTPGDFIKSSHIATFIKQKPGANFGDYWVQVTDHRMYEDPNISFNFYLDPKSWEVYFLDTETNQLWTPENWKKRSNRKKINYSTLYYPNI